MDGLESVTKLSDVAPNDLLRNVHLLRLQSTVLTNGGRLGGEVLGEEGSRRRVVVVGEDDGCRIRWTDVSSLEWVERSARRTVVSKEPSGESLSNRNDVGVSYPPPGLDRREGAIEADFVAWEIEAESAKGRWTRGEADVPSTRLKTYAFPSISQIAFHTSVPSPNTRLFFPSGPVCGGSRGASEW